MMINLGLLQSWFPTLTHQFSYNSVSWSISTEMAFYLAFPLLLTRIRQNWGSCLLIATGFLATMLTAASLLNLPADGGVEDVTITTFIYTQPLARGLEFVTGMAAYVAWHRFIRYRAISIWAYTGIEVAALVGIFWWSADGFWRAQSELASLPSVSVWFSDAGSFWAFAIVIVIFAAAGGCVGKMLSWRPFVWLGEISFSVYMFHQILIKIWVLGYPQWANPLSFLLVLIAVSALSFCLIEQPGRKVLGRLLGASRPSTGLLKFEPDASKPVAERV